LKDVSAYEGGPVLLFEVAQDRHFPLAVQGRMKTERKEQTRRKNETNE
jgi:hypothetical protein